MKLPASELAGLSLGIEMVLSVVLMGALGRWIDSKAGTAPAFLFVGVILGTAAGFRQMIRYMNRADAAQRPPDEKPPQPPPASS